MLLPPEGELGIQPTTSVESLSDQQRRIDLTQTKPLRRRWPGASITLPDRHNLRLWRPRHHRPDMIAADPLVRLPSRVVGQVGVAFHGRDLGMTEELADHLERQPEAEVGLAHHPRFRPNTLYYAPIWLLEICSRQPDWRKQP